MFHQPTDIVAYQVVCHHEDGTLELLDEGTDLMSNISAQMQSMHPDAAISYRIHPVH